MINVLMLNTESTYHTITQHTTSCYAKVDTAAAAATDDDDFDNLKTILT